MPAVYLQELGFIHHAFLRAEDNPGPATPQDVSGRMLTYYQPLQERTDLEQRLDRLLASRINPNHEELLSFHKRMLKYKDYILTFLYHPKVPPDNNECERAICNVKVKQKVSGQFNSWKGVDNFLILRSITDTALKNKQPVLNALNLIAKLAGTN